MSKFKQFPSSAINGGIQYKAFYPNGYGASIVKHSFSHGSSEGKWELAVLKGTKDNWNICYDTPITDDVLGYLSEKEVDSILEQIEKLS
jgi:hypothetical protein